MLNPYVNSIFKLDHFKWYKSGSKAKISASGLICLMKTSLTCIFEHLPLGILTIREVESSSLNICNDSINSHFCHAPWKAALLFRICVWKAALLFFDRNLTHEIYHTNSVDNAVIQPRIEVRSTLCTLKVLPNSKTAKFH